MTDTAAAPSPIPPPPAPPVTPRRRRRGLWIALIASLGVNLFLVGWVSSSWVYGPRFGPGARAAGPGMGFQHQRASRALGGDARQTADRLWRENFAELREKLRAMRESHLGLRAAFVADGADAKSMADAVAAHKEKANALFDQVNATLLKIALALPAEARKTYFGAGFPRPRAGRRAPRGER